MRTPGRYLTIFQRNPQLLFVMLASLLVLHWQTISFSLGYWWSSSTYGHGLLVLPVSMYLIWQKREALFLYQFAPSYTGLAAFIVSSIMWWLGYAADVEIIKQLGLFAMIGALFWAVAGWRITSLYWIPLVLPLFTLSLWSPLLPILQDLTTWVVSTALSLFNVPVFVESHYIQIPEGKFSIEEVCAGLRYLLAALIVALVYVYLYIRQRRYRALFIGFVVLLSLGVNWIRVFSVIVAGHMTNMTHFLVKDHADFGWWLFALTLLPIFWVGNRLSNRDRMKAEPLPVQDPAAETGVPQARRRLIVSLLAVVLFVVPLSGFLLKAQSRHLGGARSALQAPASVGPWRGPFTMTQDTIQPDYPGADQQLLAIYNKDGEEITLFLAKYINQEQDRELIGARSHPFNRDVWRVESSLQRRVTLSGKHAVDVREMVIANAAGQTRLIWYWYSVAGVDTASALQAKWQQVVGLLTADTSGANVILLGLNADNDITSARNTLADYLTHMYGALYRAVNGNG